jgi:proteasome lid subunit RPN8/RPN11
MYRRLLLVPVCFLVVVFFTYPSSNTVETTGVRISIEKQVAEEMQEAYSDTDKEVPFCLFGGLGADTVVTRIEKPRIISQTKTSVSFDGRGCEMQDGFIGYVHNHPSGYCQPSKIDMISHILNPSSKVNLIACRKGENGSYRYHGYEYTALDISTL